jgi:peptidoglycan/xylan/chitin deacetylase (PgdA/CDA1 family)
MRALLRGLVPYGLVVGAGPYYLLRPGIRILMYHRVDRLASYDQLTVSPDRFAEQMDYLARHSRVISLGQAVAELSAGPPVRPGVVVTFDDGYRDNLLHALPVLRHHQVPATIFVTTRFCDQDLSHPRYGSASPKLHLTWEEVRELANEPGITIGSHTTTHPFLSRLDPASAIREIAGSRNIIHTRVRKAVDFFCYPSGDFTAREMQLAAAAGYRAAVSVAPGVNRAGMQPYALRRTEVTDRDGSHQLALKLAGAYDPVHWWLHRRRERRFAEARAEESWTTERGAV